jgi:shikimate kinase
MLKFSILMWPRTEKPLRLALIGMSGCGKSHWAKNLAALGCPTVCCDDAIEARLATILKAGGYQGINGVAAWMGWPDSADYAEREAEYLREEIATLDEVLSGLERDPRRELVLDTTGSVICSGNHILHRLRRQMTIVYLAASLEETQLLIQRYLQDPKPVLWQGAFQPRPGESSHDTVHRCYPTLIAARRQSYETLAHLTVPTLTTRELSPPGTSRNATVARAFLEKIGGLLASRRASSSALSL